MQGQTGQGAPHDHIPVHPPAFSEPKEVLEKPPADRQKKSSVSGEGHPVILLHSQKVGGRSSHSPPAHMSKARASMSSPLTPGSRGRAGILLGKLPGKFHPTTSVLPDQAHGTAWPLGAALLEAFKDSLPYSCQLCSLFTQLRPTQGCRASAWHLSPSRGSPQSTL